MRTKNESNLLGKITKAINSVSAENESNTPDFLLGEYLITCLKAFNETTKRRDKWYAVHLEPGTHTVPPIPKKEGSGLDDVLNGHKFHLLMIEAQSAGITELVLHMPEKYQIAVNEFLLRYGDNGIIQYDSFTKHKAIKDGYTSFTFNGMTIHYR